jgi:hypothetical protein
LWCLLANHSIASFIADSIRSLRDIKSAAVVPFGRPTHVEGSSTSLCCSEVMKSLMESSAAVLAPGFEPAATLFV